MRAVIISLLLCAPCASAACAGTGSPSPDNDGSSRSAGGSGGAAGSGGQGGGGNGGGGGTAPTLEELLAALRQDVDGAMQAQSEAGGWPAPVADGVLVVSTDPTLPEVAGEHDGWTGTAMQADTGFSWVVLPLGAGSRYKLKGGSVFSADPWSRAYEHDDFGIMSMTAPAGAHLERWFQIGTGGIAPRTVRVLVPAEPATHLLYVHDGQNLFDPEAPWGGWQLGAGTPARMMIVGIDNTPARMSEYTHVSDDIGGGMLGGEGDGYADFVRDVVRPLIQARYGEPAQVGAMGSSLGGLISLHMASRDPAELSFAASLSGTVGWGSIGLHNETMIERFEAAGHGPVVLYVDSGGDGSCFDGDGDGIEDDDPNASDNYCENQQLIDVLTSAGYEEGTDLFHVHEPGAPHNEAAWAARVSGPLSIFAGM